MKFLRRVALIAVSVALICVAAPAHATDVHYDLDVDFSQYKTFAWYEASPARIPDLRDYLKNKVGGYLRAAGLKEVETDADLNVVIHVVGSSKEATVGAYIHLVSWNMGVLTQGVSSETKASLILDIVDTAEKRSVWVARANEKYIGTAQYQKIRNKIDKVTKKMFKDFPPKLR